MEGTTSPVRTGCPFLGSMVPMNSAGETWMGGDQVTPRSGESCTAMAACGDGVLSWVMRVKRFTSFPPARTTIWLEMVWASSPASWINLAGSQEMPPLLERANQVGPRTLGEVG